MSKKDIDKLFQEKLKDFREIPDEKVWKSIESSLDQQKKSRRVIPIWWRLGGVAALLAIALLVFGPFGGDSGEATITDSENTAPALESESTEGQNDFIEEAAEPYELVRDSETDESEVDADDSETEFIIDSDENQLVEESGEGQESVRGNAMDTSRDNTAIASSSVETGTEDTKNKENEAVAQTVMEENEAQPAIVAIAEEDATRPANESADQNTVEDPATEIAEQTVSGPEEDTSGKKSIYDEIKEQEEEAIADEKGGKWSVGPSIAPVYFNSFGEGSPIHSNFVSNSKSGNINMSYGVAVGYEISDRLKIRSGVHKVDYGYDTNDITFSSSLVSSTSTQISNINYTTTSRTLVVESSSAPQSADPTAVNDIIAQNPTRSGNMVQEFGYIEVPLELNYALLDRKFNIDLIGGVSSLFLVNNTVTLESGGTSTEMGEANNINDLNFSTNVGLGMNYELSNSMKVHLEPMFKYQLNTFTGTEGSFRPYSLGVYTGLSFKF